MRTILIQLDTDAHPSSFDRVVAVDAGVDELFSYGGVTTENVTPLVHGAMFTRGPADLKHTAIFVGGSDVTVGEALFRKVQSVFFGPMRVSVMMDCNGCNTTAAAAVCAAARHVELNGARAVVLGGTGPVGLRAAQILAMQGSRVRLASRSLERAEAACKSVREKCPSAELTACAMDDVPSLLEGAGVVISAGAAGAQLLPGEMWQRAADLRVAIDLNAVPPAGIEGVEVTAKAAKAESNPEVVCYGAIGVGGTKMKTHKAALQQLFTANDQVLDTERVFEIARGIG